MFLLCLASCACGVAENDSYETEECTNEIVAVGGTGSLTSVYWVEEMMQTAICDYAESVKEPFAIQQLRYQRREQRLLQNVGRAWGG